MLQTVLFLSSNFQVAFFSVVEKLDEFAEKLNWDFQHGKVTSM